LNSNVQGIYNTYPVEGSLSRKKMKKV